MKKVFFILSMVLLILGSCNQKKSYNTTDSKEDSILILSAQQTQNVCPMKVDEVTTLTNVNYDPSTLKFTYIYEIGESQVPLSALQQSADILGQSIVANLDKNEMSKIMLKPLAEIDGRLHYVYKGSQSGDTFTIVVDPKDNSYEFIN